MTDYTSCPQCQATYRTAGMPAMKRLRCTKCRAVFVVPEDSAEQSQPAATPFAPGSSGDGGTAAPPDKDVEHAIPAAIGDISTLSRANFEGGVTLDGLPLPGVGDDSAFSDTIDGLPRPVERKSEAALEPAAADEKYVVEGEIARGGMGVILCATDRDIHRPVAMKVMLDAKSQKDRARFVEEAQVTGQLEHPNIVPIHELGIDAENRLFFTMKLVKGRSLKEILDALRDVEKPERCDGQGSPRSTRHSELSTYRMGRLLNSFTSICNAIAFAHAKGVVHRDLKPANIMFGDYGEVLVMDWGLAKPGAAKPSGRGVGASPAPGAGETSSTQVDASTDSRDRALAEVLHSMQRETGGDLTMDGTIVGTPHYMPPEQADGKIAEIDARSDIYSLGAILYEILTLETPCEGAAILSLIVNVSQGNITPPDQRAPKRNIPKELSAITMKALARRKKDRYQRVEDLRRDIELYMEGRAVSAKLDTAWETLVKLVKRNQGVSVATAAALVVLISVVSVAFWINLQEKRRAEGEADKARIARDEATRARTDAERQRDSTAKAYEELKAARHAREKAEVARRTLEDKAAEESRREWHLAFEEDFSVDRILERSATEGNVLAPARGTEGEVAPERPEVIARCWVESRWEIVGAKWELKNGELRLLPAAPRSWMHLKTPMTGDVKIEFDCHEEGQNLNDISCFLNAPPRDKWPANTTQAPGYHFKYGGWHNSRITLEQGVRTLFTLNAQPLVRGKTYHVKAERIGPRLVLTVDDKEIYDVQDPQPPELGPDHSLAGLYACGSESWINNVRIYTLGKPRKVDILELAEDYARKGNCRTAQDLFQDVLDSDSDPGRLDQAHDGKARAVGTLELPGYKAALDKAWPDVKFSLQVKAYGLQLDASKTAVSDLRVLAGMKLAALNLDGSKVTDLSPLKGMPLASLNCASLQLKSLEVLRGLKLRRLECQANQIKSLEPLRGMPLTWLNCSANSISTLEPLRGMSLTRLECQGNQIGALEPLQGMPLGWLNCGTNKVPSLEPLRGMALARLECQSNPISTLGPLRGLPLSALNICRTRIEDLSLVRELPLKSLDLDYAPERDAAMLRSAKTLETINGVPVADFWVSDTTSQVRSFVGQSVGSERYVGAVAFLPDGKRVLFGCGDKRLRLWDVETGKVIREYVGHTVHVCGVAVTPDGTRAFSGAADKTWRLWDIESGKEIRRVEKLTSDVNGVAVAPDGQQGLTTASDNSVRLWDLETGRELRHFDGHAGKVWCAAFSPDGKTVLSTSEDGTLRLWDRQTGAQTQLFDAKKPVHAVVLSADGKQAVITCTDGSVRLLDLAQNVETRRFVGHSKQVWGTAFSPDGKSLLSGSDDASLRLWDVETGKQLRRFQRHSGGVLGVAFSPDGRQAVSGGADNTLRLWALPGPNANEPTKAR